MQSSMRIKQLGPHEHLCASQIPAGTYVISSHISVKPKSLLNQSGGAILEYDAALSCGSLCIH